MIAVRLDPVNGIRAVVVRHSHTEPRVLVLTRAGLRPLLHLGVTDALGIKLGPLLQLRRRHEDGILEPFALDAEDEFWRATADPATGLVYLSSKSTLLQLDIEDNNTVTLLAGLSGEEDQIDGPGGEARVERPFCVVADGRGSLLIKDCGSSCVRRVQLPPPGSPPNTPSPSVTTLPDEYPDNVWALALDYTEPQRMYVATKTAIYRHDTLPYRPSLPPAAAAAAPPGAAAGAAAGAAGTARAAQPVDASAAGELAATFTSVRNAEPVLLAGLEGDDEQVDGLTACDDDGTGAASPGTARFCHIMCMLVDCRGRLLVAERAHDEACIRIVSPCGLVSTFAAGFDVGGSEYELTILPHGWLAVHAWDDQRIHLLQLGPRLAPSAPAPGPSASSKAVAGAAGGSGGAGEADVQPGRPGLAGLAADLGALLECPAKVASADVEVVVGGRAFPCHRAVLGARCEYFRGRFASGLADSAGSKVELPDACPDSFALLLRYLYTSTLAIPPALLRPTLELADRLLLPAAADVASQQLLAAVGPTSVVAELLWAEGRCFPALTAGLKAYYLEHAHAVLEEAPDSIEQLMVASPRLHLELYAAGLKRARRR